MYVELDILQCDSQVREEATEGLLRVQGFGINGESKSCKPMAPIFLKKEGFESSD